MRPLFPLLVRAAVLILNAPLTSGCAAAQPSGGSDLLALEDWETCALARKHEEKLDAEISQQPDTPIISAKRAYRGEAAHLIYFCAGDDRVTSRSIYLRYQDASSADSAFERHVAAAGEEFGKPCASWSSVATGKSQATPYRAVVWNVRPGYAAILFLFDGDSSRPWQLQLHFHALTHVEISERIESIWRDNGCDLPIPSEIDPRVGGMTLLIL